MRILMVELDGTIAKVGTENVLESSTAMFINFSFSNEWNGLQKIVVFETETRKFTLTLNERSETVNFPSDLTDGDNYTFSFYVEGRNSDKEIELESTRVIAGRNGNTWEFVGYIPPTHQRISLFSINPDTEPHIIVNDDRTITVPEELKNIGVQHDHNIETVSFDLPRYWDGNDLSEMVIYIIYQLADRTINRYVASNVKINSENPSLINFDWTISRNVTEYAGTIQIMICAVSTDADGNENCHWNSKINNDLFISEGMYCYGNEILAGYPDLVTELISLTNKFKFLKDVNEVAY